MIHTDETTAVVTYRGDAVENKHSAHIAVVDATGRLLFRFGDPFRRTLARSAAKPAQALAVLEAGGVDKFAFDVPDLALMCASHSSEPQHIERAAEMLKKANAQDSDLRCGSHEPLSEAVGRDWIKRDYVPTGICSNCSGKHVGMLAGAQALGASKIDYHLADHPMQLLVKRTVADMCELPECEVEWAIDGCNLPTPAFPLDRLALIYGKFAQAVDAVAAGGGSISDRVKSLARIANAMIQYPEYVAGEGRFCTALMRAFEGRLIGKLGADGCYGIGVMASAATKALGAEGAVGIAVKIEDGNIDVLYSLVSEVLHRLNIGKFKQRAELAQFHMPRMANTMNVVTGHRKFPFSLVPA